MTHTFKGGVHPDYMKAPEIPMTVMTPPPLRQGRQFPRSIHRFPSFLAPNSSFLIVFKLQFITL